MEKKNFILILPQSPFKWFLTRFGDFSHSIHHNFAHIWTKSDGLSLLTMVPKVTEKKHCAVPPNSSIKSATWLKISWVANPILAHLKWVLRWTWALWQNLLNHGILTFLLDWIIPMAIKQNWNHLFMAHLSTSSSNWKNCTMKKNLELLY